MRAPHRRLRAHSMLKETSRWFHRQIGLCVSSIRHATHNLLEKIGEERRKKKKRKKKKKNC